jgi:hypothetical protein
MFKFYNAAFGFFALLESAMNERNGVKFSPFRYQPVISS